MGFDEDVSACAADVNQFLPHLQKRYTAHVIVVAFADHLGVTLRTLIARRIFCAEAVERFLGQVGDIAFGVTPPSQRGNFAGYILRGARRVPVTPAVFEQQVRRCADEITAFLPGLAARHSRDVALAALITEVAAGLYVSRELGTCTHAEALEVMRRIEESAFADVGRTDGQARHIRTQSTKTEEQQDAGNHSKSRREGDDRGRGRPEGGQAQGKRGGAWH